MKISFSAPPSVRSAGFPPDLTLEDEAICVCAIKKATSVTWRKNGIEVKTTPRISVSPFTGSSSTLTIRRIQPEDVGNYTCVASNALGSTDVTIPLVVRGQLRKSYCNLFWCNVANPKLP